MSSKRKMKVGVLMAATVLLTVLAGSAVLAGSKPAPSPPPAYSLAELKALQGFTASYGNDVNDLGQVVGYMRTASGGSHAAVWETPSVAPRQLPLPVGYSGSQADAINNLGQIVGRAGCIASGLQHPVIWVLGPGGYEMQDLTGDPADDGYAWDINEDGYVSGYQYHSGDTSEEDLDLAFVIVPEDTNDDGLPDSWFRDDNGDGINDLMCMLAVYRDPGSGWWYWTEPGTINDSGWVVGNCQGYADFLIIPDYSLPNPWFKDADGDGTNDLAILVGPWAGCYIFMNNERQMDSGSRLVQIARGTQLFQVDVAPDGTVTVTEAQLPPTTTYAWYYAWSINDSGQVVGRGRPLKRGNADYDPLLWQTDKGTRLVESLSDMASFSDLSTARTINSLGQIVGSGTTRAGERGYVATPVGN